VGKLYATEDLFHRALYQREVVFHRHIPVTLAYIPAFLYVLKSYL
jgi:hypothetical protein